MDHFAGLDVSVKETSICTVDDTGKIVREAKVASEMLSCSRSTRRAPFSRSSLATSISITLSGEAWRSAYAGDLVKQCHLCWLCRASSRSLSIRQNSSNESLAAPSLCGRILSR